MKKLLLLTILSLSAFANEYYTQVRRCTLSGDQSTISHPERVSLPKTFSLTLKQTLIKGSRHVIKTEVSADNPLISKFSKLHFSREINNDFILFVFAAEKRRESGEINRYSLNIDKTDPTEAKKILTTMGALHVPELPYGFEKMKIKRVGWSGEHSTSSQIHFPGNIHDGL